MACKLDPMDLKQIIQSHLDGFSNRQTASLLGISRNTINHYMRLFIACEWSMEELLGFDNVDLEVHFPIRSTINNNRYNSLMKYFEKVNEARNHPGFTFQFHYLEYKEQSSNPYSYTQFMEHYNRKHAKIRG